MGFLRTGRELLRAHEIVVLEALGGALAPPAGELLERQLSEVRRAQRLFAGSEVNLYPRRHGPGAWPQDSLFPARATELRLAAVRLDGPQGSGSAAVHAVRGHVFSLVFRPAPHALGKDHEIAATEVTLYADPLDAGAGRGVAGLLERVPARLRAELEDLWASPSRPQGLVSREEVHEFPLADGDHLLVAQVSDTSLVAVPLESTDTVVRRFGTDGRVLGEYVSVAEALAAAD